MLIIFVILDINLKCSTGYNIYVLNSCSGTAILRSGTNALNIGVWNTVFASRKNRKGTLKVNDEIHSDQSPRGTRSAELNGPLYVGGVKYWERIPGQVGVRDGFEGCIRKVNR